MAKRLAEFTLDGPTGCFDRQSGIVRFEPAARRQFTATDDLKAQIAAMRRQIQAATRRAEVAETQLSRLRQSAPAVSPATTPADAFAMMAGRIYSERRQPAGGSPAAIYGRRQAQVEVATDPPEEETAPEPFGMSAESVYAARRKAAQRLL